MNAIPFWVEWCTWAFYPIPLGPPSPAVSWLPSRLSLSAWRRHIALVLTPGRWTVPSLHSTSSICAICTPSIRDLSTLTLSVRTCFLLIPLWVFTTAAVALSVPFSWFPLELSSLWFVLRSCSLLFELIAQINIFVDVQPSRYSMSYRLSYSLHFWYSGVILACLSCYRALFLLRSCFGDVMADPVLFIVAKKKPS